MPDRYHRMTAAARELRAGYAFELELSQQVPFFGREPSPALAVVEKLLQQDVGVGILVAHIRFKNRGRSSVRLIPQRSVRVANRPPECAPAYLSRDGKPKMRMAGMQFFGMKEFEKDGKKMLRRVIAGQ